MVAPGSLFARPVSSATVGQIILWWEARRLHYNVILFVWAMILIFAIVVVRDKRELGDDPAGVIAAVIFGYLVLFQLPANLWYTGGWIADVLVERVLRLPAPWFGPCALALGIAVSILFYVWIVAHLWRSGKR